MNIKTQKKITVSDCQQNPDKIYVFGDNLAKRGKKGQAAIRDCSNSFGVPTKRLPAMTDSAFFCDEKVDLDPVKQSLRELYQLARSGKTIIFPEDGLGTGLAKMQEKSPLVFQVMNGILKKHFGIK